MLSRAEHLRGEKLEQNVRRLHENNEQLAIKQAAKRKMLQESEYERLRQMVLHRQEVLKKAKKRAEFMQEVKEHRANSNLDKNEHKRMRLSDIQRQFQDKLKAIQSKQTERDQVKASILTALSKYNS